MWSLSKSTGVRLLTLAVMISRHSWCLNLLVTGCVIFLSFSYFGLYNELKFDIMLQLTTCRCGYRNCCLERSPKASRLPPSTNPMLMTELKTADSNHIFCEINLIQNMSQTVMSKFIFNIISSQADDFFECRKHSRTMYNCLFCFNHNLIYN